MPEGVALVLAGAAVLAAGVLALGVLVSLRRAAGAVSARLVELEQRLQGRLDGLGREGQAAVGQQLGQLAITLTDGIARVREETRMKVDEALARAGTDLRSQFEGLRGSVEKKLAEIRGEVEAKLGETVARNLAAFGAVGERLERLREATGQVVQLSAGIEQLSRALSTPKGRGAFGELSLGELLADVLPRELYDEQWEIEPGERVDAAIHLRHGTLPIDAKFTVVPPHPEGEDSDAAGRDFSRAVEARAREIRAKYIRPPRTLDFAFMYVPAESVFHRIIMERQLQARLLAMKVVPTSPNTLYAHLQALAIGFRGMKIEEKAHEIEKLLGALGRDFSRFVEDFRVLGKHIDHARQRYQEAAGQVERFEDRLQALQLGQEAGEPSALPPAGEPPSLTR